MPWLPSEAAAQTALNTLRHPRAGEVSSRWRYHGRHANRAKGHSSEDRQLNLYWYTKVLCSEGHSALTFNFRDGTFPIEDTNEENFCSISRHRPPLFRRPPAVWTRRLRELPRKSNSHSCCRRLRRCIFRIRSYTHQSSSQFVQVVHHPSRNSTEVDYLITPQVSHLKPNSYVNFSGRR
jgi:hypothetical protein